LKRTAGTTQQSRILSVAALGNNRQRWQEIIMNGE
jgi:hypothetical protein